MRNEIKQLKNSFLPSSMQGTIASNITFKSNLAQTVDATNAIITIANTKLNEAPIHIISPGTNLNSLDTLNEVLFELDKTKKLLAEKAKSDAKAMQSFARIYEEIDKRIAAKASDLSD